MKCWLLSFYIDSIAVVVMLFCSKYQQRYRIRIVLFSVHIANEPKSIDIIMWHALRIFFLVFFNFSAFSPYQIHLFLYSGLACRLVERSVELAHFSIYSDWWCDMFRAWDITHFIRSLVFCFFSWCSYLYRSVTG